MKSYVFREGFVPYKFYPKGAEFEPSGEGERVFIQEIIIEEHEELGQDKALDGVSREAYSLQVFEDGHTLISIVAYEGGLHALNSLSQLFYAHSSYPKSKDVYTPLAPILIRDHPLFAHRGLLLDISRNCITPNDVKRTLEALSFNKFNRLHIHATDSQSWPVEIPSLPDLASKGAYHKAQIWSTVDLREMQEYGALRGVEVYVEIDMPGHTASIWHAYPELVTAYDQRPWEPYAAEPPSGQLKLNSPQVLVFLDKLFNDLLPRISPYTCHFHIGGDELNTKSYELDPTVNSGSKKVIRPYLQKFFDHVFSHIKTHHLTPIAFEEIILEWELALPKDIIIQTWRSQAGLAKVVEKGYKALFGPSTSWYLDCGFGSWADPDPDNPNTPVRPPFLDWCSPYKSWRQVYSYDPFCGIAADKQHFLVGGECFLWGELTDSVSLDGMLWPRACAAAEVLWRGPGRVSEDVTRRLAEMRERLVGRGFGAGVVQMEWCLSNPGGALR